MVCAHWVLTDDVAHIALHTQILNWWDDCDIVGKRDILRKQEWIDYIFLSREDAGNDFINPYFNPLKNTIELKFEIQCLYFSE